MTIQSVIFPNGFRLIYEKPKNKLPITSIQLFCDVGSVHEDGELRGASHFIEHMCFKGTRDYPNSINGNTGRGFFFFPNKSNPEGRKELGYMLLYEMFEELEDDSGEGLRLEA